MRCATAGPRVLETLQVQTPNEHADRMVNVWNAYQCMVTFNLSRSASSFESGIGRGMGFRDSNQDLLGFVHDGAGARARTAPRHRGDTTADRRRVPPVPAAHEARERRGRIGFQRRPAVARARRVRLPEGDGRPRRSSTNPCPTTTLRGARRRCASTSTGRVQYTLDRLGPHGLPLIGRADWNDCLNLNCFSEEPGESFQTTENREGGVAESVFIAGLFVLAATELADLRDARGPGARRVRGYTSGPRRCATRCSARAGTASGSGGPTTSSVCRSGHARTTRASASSSRRACASWPVSASTTVGHSRRSTSVAERLATPHGIVLLQPAYTRYHVELGEITTYPPGYKENAGVFCHTNPWVMIAETRVGHPDDALDYYLRINPSAREAISDVHRCEPYVYAQMIAGRDAPTHGEAKNSWLTGTAAWNFVAVTQWVLGIRPALDGLHLDPCLPGAWTGFTAVRRFRGATYRIDVRKPAGVVATAASLPSTGRDWPARSSRPRPRVRSSRSSPPSPNEDPFC